MIVGHLRRLAAESSGSNHAAFDGVTKRRHLTLHVIPQPGPIIQAPLLYGLEVPACGSADGHRADRCFV